MEVQYAALGPLSVRCSGRELDLGWAKQQAVLAVLLLEMNRPVPVNRIITSVWGDRRPRNAKNAVQTYISRLRKVLAQGGGTDELLVSTDAGYLIRGDPAGLDIAVFERRVADARHCRQYGDPHTAAGHLDDALALWRGEPFSGLDGPRIAARRGQLEELRLAALELRAEIHLEQGRLAEAISELTSLISLDTLREHPYALLMLALYRSSRQAEALAMFLDIRGRLANGLGIDPGPELRTLHERILRGDTDLVDHVLTARSTGRNDLPADIVDFVGRQREIAGLLDAVAAGDGGPAAVVAVIDGMAGVGKTALAVHLAHRVADRYPDAQLFLDLQGHSVGRRALAPAVALDALLRAIDVSGAPVPGSLAERSALWRAELASRRVLVVLDNAESADQVRALLPGTAGCLTLVTSRRRLVDFEAAHLVSLDVLPESDAVALFSNIVGADRASAEPDAVREVVDRCGMLPLAIRSAAGRLRSRSAWSIGHLAERLRDSGRRLGELAAGSQDVTVAFAQSYQRIGRHTQRLFRLLALHPGHDFDVHAAASLADIDPESAERALDDLVDVHLLQEVAPGRYRFHELVRRYATTTVHAVESTADQQACIARLVRYYLTAAAIAERLSVHEGAEIGDGLSTDAWYPDDDEASARAWLRTERANLLAIAQLAHGRDKYSLWRAASPGAEWAVAGSAGW